MNQIISEKEIQEWKKNLKGQVRGVAFKGYQKFILEKEGPDGLKKLEEEVSRITQTFDLNRVEAMKFYPFWFYVAVLEIIKRLFDYNDEKFQEMGRFNIKTSLLIRSSLKYFLSLERVLKETPRLWKKYLTAGTLYIKEYNEKEQRIVIQIKDYYGTPLQCSILKGFFVQALEMVLKKEGECKETKCIYRGDEYHEFLITW